MRKPLRDSLATILIILFFVSPAWATCGGGGGGGGGGTSSGGGAGPAVYNVPWKVWTAKETPDKGLILYWFPLSQKELEKSSLRSSRILSLYSSQCVTMQVADPRFPELQKVLGDSKPPVAVLANADGSTIKKVEGKDGFLKAEPVEKAVDSEMKQRENMLNEHLKEAKDK